MRAAKGWRQADLATHSGVSIRHISNIENGGNASMEILEQLAGALGASLLSVMGDSPIRVVDQEPGGPQNNHWEVIDFYEGMVETPIVAEVACGEPMDYSVDGETVLVRSDKAPDPAKGEFLLRARGESMIEFGVHDGDLIVAELRPGKFPASGEIIIAWYEPADGAQPGGITMKRWVRRGGRKLLQAGNPESQSYELKEGDIFELKGIVRRALRAIDFPKISG